MGKTDKTQARLQYERRKTQGPAGDGTVTGLEKGPEGTPGEEQDLRQLLVSMQHSLNQIDGKIDALAYRIDRMSERIDKHAERLDHVENRVSATEDGQTELTGGQMKLSKELSALKLKVIRLFNIGIIRDKFDLLLVLTFELVMGPSCLRDHILITVASLLRS
ncbi:hypothetical protein NDU88_007742 [Pleurodeles waltl]|uniref:t-SNARE coiled-coil homology domain-containing protein n=1 Tax=Pleurodeles waltl TaxID=8319 RepID=A0AAV7QQT1_PLEWA|nr:hypothetical protein NDU88_007742 [Pleurodeles waltl]